MFWTMTEFLDQEEISSGAKGKQAELIVFGKLLERGYKVYTPIVDTGVDCLVDVGGGNYKEIQVKFREDSPIFTARKFKPRDNFYFVCFLSSRRGDDFWILPSKIFAEMGVQTETRKKEYVQLRMGKEGSGNYDELLRYHDNFGILLSGATKEVRRAVEQVSKRVEGPHLKQTHYKTAVLHILRDAKQNPLERKEIVKRIYERLHSQFSKADIEKSKATGMARWEKTARWTITDLKRDGLIKPVKANQWVITDKGLYSVEKYTSLVGWMEKSGLQREPDVKRQD